MVVDPHIHQAASKLVAVIDEEYFGWATMPDQSIEDLHHMFSLEAIACIDRQGLSGEDIDHRQDSKLAFMAALIGNKIHRLNLT